jgi:hypothetical protein
MNTQTGVNFGYARDGWMSKDDALTLVSVTSGAQVPKLVSILKQLSATKPELAVVTRPVIKKEMSSPERVMSLELYVKNLFRHVKEIEWPIQSQWPIDQTEDEEEFSEAASGEVTVHGNDDTQSLAQTSQQQSTIPPSHSTPSVADHASTGNRRNLSQIQEESEEPPHDGGGAGQEQMTGGGGPQEPGYGQMGQQGQQFKGSGLNVIGISPRLPTGIAQQTARHGQYDQPFGGGTSARSDRWASNRAAS